MDLDLEEMKKIAASVVTSGYWLWTETPAEPYALELKERRDFEEDRSSGVRRRRYVFLRKPRGPFKRWSEECDVCVTVDVARPAIIEAASDQDLFEFPYMGSAAIGVAALSAPVMLMIAPALLAVRGVNAYRTKRTGLDVFARRFLHAVKKALGDGEDYALLEAAVHATQAAFRERLRKVTLSEALTIVADCVQFRTNIVRPDGTFSSATCHWERADGEAVGEGSMQDDGSWLVGVRGSRFEGNEAVMLVGTSLEQRIEAFHLDDEGRLVRSDGSPDDCDDDPSGVLAN